MAGPHQRMIIDFHTHIHPPGLRDCRSRYLDRDATFRELYANARARLAGAEDLIDSMDEHGVDLSVVMGAGWSDIDWHGSRMTTSSIRCVVSPVGWWLCVCQSSLGEQAVEELERCVAEAL